MWQLGGLFNMIRDKFGGGQAPNPATQPIVQSMGTAGGPSPQLKPLAQTSREELEAWEGYDPNIEGSRMNQYANAVSRQTQQNQPGADPSVSQALTQAASAASPTAASTPSSTSPTPTSPAATPQGGSPEAGGLLGKFKKWGEGYQQRMEDRGLIHDVFRKPEEMEKPWSVKDIPKENWKNWEMGVLQNPHEMDEEALMKLAMGEDGQLDQGRWNMIKEHIESSKTNPFVEKNMAPKGSMFDYWGNTKKLLGLDS